MYFHNTLLQAFAMFAMVKSCLPVFNLNRFITRKGIVTLAYLSHTDVAEIPRLKKSLKIFHFMQLGIQRIFQKTLNITGILWGLYSPILLRLYNRCQM